MYVKVIGSNRISLHNYVMHVYEHLTETIKLLIGK